MSEDQSDGKVFGMTIREIAILVTIFSGLTTGGFAGVTALLGSSNQAAAAQAIEVQTDEIGRALRPIRDKLNQVSDLSEMNSHRLDKLEEGLEAEFDTLETTIMKVGANLEGYLKGRLDGLPEN